MKALITGASSGMGADMARILSQKGYDLILVARRQDRLEALAKELSTNVEIIALDLSKEDNCQKLYSQVKNQNIDILINNAGFGSVGDFTKLPLEQDLNMIDINVKAVHILTKLFLPQFEKRNSGYILNVASSAAFQPGPLMATYYATKSYVYFLTCAIYEELRRKKSKVVVSCLCPGPVNTEFNEVAKVSFKAPALDSKFAAEYAIKKMFKKKLIIIPGYCMRLVYYFSKLVPRKLKLKVTYNVQTEKLK